MRRVSEVSGAILVQAVAALLGGTVLTYLAIRDGQVVEIGLLYLLLSFVVFILFAILRSAAVSHRFGPGGGDDSWRNRPRNRPGGPRNGPGLGGVREPRRPYPPRMPTRGAAAEPDTTPLT